MQYVLISLKHQKASGWQLISVLTFRLAVRNVPGLNLVQLSVLLILFLALTARVLPVPAGEDRTALRRTLVSA